MATIPRLPEVWGGMRKSDFIDVSSMTRMGKLLIVIGNIVDTERHNFAQQFNSRLCIAGDNLLQVSPEHSKAKGIRGIMAE
jgi:hypothetical protein